MNVRLKIKYLTTTAKHAQTNGQMEKFGIIIVARRLHYVAKHKTDLDHNVRLMTYAHNAQVRQSPDTTPFSLELSHQPPGPATASPASAISCDITELLHPQNFCSRSPRQLDILRKQLDVQLTNAQTCYKQNFYKTVRSTPKLYPGQQILVDGPSAQMSGSARMTNMSLTKFLPWTSDPFEAISATLDIIEVDENDIQNTISIERVTISLCNAGSNDGIDQHRDTQKANYRGDEGVTEWNNEIIIGEFPTEQIVKQNRIGKRSKFIIQWYGYVPEADILEPPQHIL